MFLKNGDGGVVHDSSGKTGGQLLRSYGIIDHPLKVSLRTSFAGLRARSADDAYICFYRDAAAMQAH